MTIMAQHLRIDALEARVGACSNVVKPTHCEAIWLLARRPMSAEVASAGAHAVPQISECVVPFRSRLRELAVGPRS